MMSQNDIEKAKYNRNTTSVTKESNKNSLNNNMMLINKISSNEFENSDKEEDLFYIKNKTEKNQDNKINKVIKNNYNNEKSENNNPDIKAAIANKNLNWNVNVKEKEAKSLNENLSDFLNSNLINQKNFKENEERLNSRLTKYSSKIINNKNFNCNNDYIINDKKKPELNLNQSYNFQNNNNQGFIVKLTTNSNNEIKDSNNHTFPFQDLENLSPIKNKKKLNIKKLEQDTIDLNANNNYNNREADLIKLENFDENVSEKLDDFSNMELDANDLSLIDSPEMRKMILSGNKNNIKLNKSKIEKTNGFDFDENDGQIKFLNKYQKVEVKKSEIRYLSSDNTIVKDLSKSDILIRKQGTEQNSKNKKSELQNDKLDDQIQEKINKTQIIFKADDKAKKEKNKIFSPIKKILNDKKINQMLNLSNNNNNKPNLLINIYNNANKEDADKSGILNGLDSEQLRKDRKVSLNSFTVYRNFNQYKKEEFKKMIDDPLFPNIVFCNDFHPIKGFAAKSFINFKKSNEDKLNIHINMKIRHPQNLKQIIPINFFSVFDGHGGEAIAEELNENLHKQIVYSKNFFENPIEAILLAFQKIEEKILKKNYKLFTNNPEKSGSCAIISIFIGDVCYIANLGDSRGIISRELGEKINQVSIDHKPWDENEKTRIIRAGGFVYRSDIIYESVKVNPIYRIKPGGLAVSRTIGDVESKLTDYGGKPNLVLAIPDVLSFKVTEEFDYLILASDGIFDKLSNKDITIIVLETCLETLNKEESFERLLINIENNILKEAIDRDSRDNVSCIFICFNNFYEVFLQKDFEKLKNSIDKLRNNPLEFDFLYDNLLMKKFVNDKKELNTSLIYKPDIGKIKDKENIKKTERSIKVKKKRRNKIFDFFCMCLGIDKKKN